MSWIIQDWAGNSIAPFFKFKTFEDAWEYIRETWPNEEDWEDYYVCETKGYDA